MSTELLRPCTGDIMEIPQLHVGSGAISDEAILQDPDMLSQAAQDRYRCPENFFDFTLSGELSPDEGYFRFGPNAICYGRSRSGVRGARVESSLYDALRDVGMEDGKLRLAFNPTEIVDKLRLERYPHAGLSGYESILKKAYYWLRPLTNETLRKGIKKFHARNWQRLPFPQWPVDTTVENICETLLLLSLQAKGIDRIPFVWFWPRGARGCIMMTHDIETETGRDLCPDLMELDDSLGIKSSFQIVPEERYAVSSEFLQTIRKRGFELGIHDLNHDGRLFDNHEEFLRRAAIINRYGTEYAAKGFRAAVLYRRPEWFDKFHFSFDMSIPNVAHLEPQRGGCCTVMPYFIGDILELPLTTTQDYTLFQFLDDRSIDLWKTQTELILKKNGLVSFIVHPDYVTQDDTQSVYKDLLGYLRELVQKTTIWFAVPSDVDSWWRQRSKMSIVKDGGSWRIDGEGADRAVLAFAKNVDGCLVYELGEMYRVS